MLNQLHHRDCVEGMRDLPDESVHLTVTSPPYNLAETAKKNPIVYYDYTDDMPHALYLSWLTDVLTEVYRVSTPDGRCAINIGDQKNGAMPVHSDVISLMRDIGWHPYASIIWDKQQTRNRAAWGSFQSPSSPSFPSPVEYILIFHKDDRKLQRRSESDLTKEEFIEWAYGLWRIPPENGMKKYDHPAMFPEAIPHRLIKMLSYPGDTVLDPFAGVGTTLAVAQKLRRCFVGYEIDRQYAEKAWQRLSQQSLAVY